jgi:flagellar hook-associated protein 2
MNPMSTPLTSIGGLASGIDFPALTDAIIASRARPIRALEARIQTNQARSEAYLTLEAQLKALQSAAQALENPTALTGMKATVAVPGGGNAGFSVSASRAATAGTFEVTVLEVAERERLGGGTFASRNDALGLEGSFVINGVGIEAGPDDSLDTLVARINAAEGAGVRASIVTVAEGEHRLVLSNLSTGAQGMTLDDPDGVLEGLGVVDAGGSKEHVLQSGADARLRVDGVEVTRSSNTIDDVLEGVTFQLHTADPAGRADVNVAQDTAALTTAIQAFVEGYNATTQFIRGTTRSTEDARAPLAGDSVMRTLGSSLQSAMLSLGQGVPGAPNRLSDLGITLQVDGTFRIDQTRLAEAVAANPDAVADLFAQRTTSSDPAVTFLRATNDTREGNYAVEITAQATAASATGTAPGGPLTGVGEGDRIRIASLQSSRQIEVELEEGMTVEVLAQRIQEAFEAEGMSVLATVEDGALAIRHQDVGSNSGFRIETEGNAAALAGIAAGEYRGTNVQGTVNGQEAVGNGRVLTVTGEGDARGLSLRVDGMPEEGAATFSLSRGIAAQVRRTTGIATGTGNASISATRDRLEEASRRLSSRAEDIKDRLEAQREEMNKRFAAVEEAISRAQSQGTYLGAQLDQISKFQYGPRRR